ncbi:protein YgfX [Pseudomonas sp. 30_B]|uniref:protein YgfX n=1 Tax=Pseudomonas sp. 30_B TaxID=2813575 RepID=UPI001A9F6A0F
MSSRSDSFECHWRPSIGLLVAYLGAQSFAVLALLLADIPFHWISLGLSLCLLHACWVVPGRILLRGPAAVRALRHDAGGWQLWSEREGFQPVQLMPDSLALPALIVLRFRRPGQWLVGSVCVPADALAPELHRRLRVRLRFSRNRWAAPG